jgi:hypothetical protein
MFQSVLFWSQISLLFFEIWNFYQG